MKIKPDDLVLEVGSGDKPYPQSDVLLDKFFTDSSEREAGKKMVIDRPLVIGEVEALPFTNKSFDYIIASHVLEHAHNPAKFLNELTRVGKRGYIETPLPLRERIFDWPFHRWYVSQEAKRLILVKKTLKSKQFFAGMTTEERKNFYCLEGKKLLNLKFEWEEKIDYKILPKEPEKFLEDLDKKLMEFQADGLLEEFTRKALHTRAHQWLKDNLFKIKFGVERKLQAGKRKSVNLFSLIVCPVCRNKLEREKDNLVCRECGHQYPLLRDEIPHLGIKK